MPYMIYQQYKSAIKAAYRNDDGLSEMYSSAKSCRKWFNSLEIDPRLLDPLVEQIAWIEDAFEELLREADRTRDEK